MAGTNSDDGIKQHVVHHPDEHLEEQASRANDNHNDNHGTDHQEDKQVQGEHYLTKRVDVLLYQSLVDGW